MLHAGDEYLISTLIPFEPAQISFDPRECLHLLLILLNQPSFDDLVGLSASGIGVTVNLWCDFVLTYLESARCPPPKGQFLTTFAASKGEKKPAHSDNNDAPAIKLPTKIVEITSDPRTSEEDKVEMPADAYESTQKGRLL
ncbi:BnaCnng59470D [Brassica napus]|uniref:BnaCnng59470D protein n=1 Tax=Brassica napus TaxID=3708 RepID=A0A078JSZ7_BRANA|nr:BnaCnng59470D [Brassica napus]